MNLDIAIPLLAIWISWGIILLSFYSYPDEFARNVLIVGITIFGNTVVLATIDYIIFTMTG